MFLGQRFIRRPKGRKRHVYTLVCNDALASIKRKIKALTGRSTRDLALAELLRRLNRAMRGWAAYFRYAAAKRTFAYLGYYVWRRVVGWLRKKHPRLSWKQIRRRYFGKDRLQETGSCSTTRPACASSATATGARRSPPPGNENTVDPTGSRYRRSRHDDDQFLDRVQQTLA